MRVFTKWYVVYFDTDFFLSSIYYRILITTGWVKRGREGGGEGGGQNKSAYRLTLVLL